MILVYFASQLFIPDTFLAKLSSSQSSERTVVARFLKGSKCRDIVKLTSVEESLRHDSKKPEIRCLRLLWVSKVFMAFEIIFFNSVTLPCGLEQRFGSKMDPVKRCFSNTLN